MELLCDDLVVAVAIGAAVLDRLVQGDEDAQAVALIARINQDRALLHQIAVALEDEVDRGVEQRVAGADEGRDRGPGDLGLVEADALVAREHRRASADLAVALAQRARHAGDLEAAGLAPVDAPAQVLEGLAEEALDVVGLEALGVCPLHLLADRLDPTEREGLLGQRAALEQVQEVGVAGRVVDHLQEARLDLGLLAVADCLDQQVAQRLLLEQLAEDAVDPAAERLARCLELLQEAVVDGALAGLAGEQVPEVADLGLADAVDAAEALLDAIGVPGQVIVDHEVRALEVDAFAGGIVGDHDQDRGVVQEGRHRGLSRLAGEAAVDLDYGLGAPEAGADPVGEVGERVPRLGKHDQLAAVAFGVGHQRLVEDALQLAPLGIGARAAERLGLLLEPGERRDLDLELSDGLGGRGAVDQLLLDRLDLVLGLLVQVLKELRAMGGQFTGRIETGFATVVQEARFFDAPLELLAAAAEQFVDRSRRRGETSLQDLEREADVLTPLIGLG